MTRLEEIQVKEKRLHRLQAAGLISQDFHQQEDFYRSKPQMN